MSEDMLIFAKESKACHLTEESHHKNTCFVGLPTETDSNQPVKRDTDLNFTHRNKTQNATEWQINLCHLHIAKNGFSMTRPSSSQIKLAAKQNQQDQEKIHKL